MLAAMQGARRDPLHIMHTVLRVVQHAAAWVQPVRQLAALMQSRGS